jgi:integrase/recombinase XerD
MKTKGINNYRGVGFEEVVPYTIRFFILKARTNQHILYCRIVLARKKCDFSLKQEVKIQDWDSEAGRFMPTSNFLKRQNFKLTEIEGKVFGIYNELKRSGIHINPSMLRDSYRGKKESVSDYTLMSFLDTYIEEIRSKPQEYTPSTIHHYTGLKNHLSEFLKAQHLSPDLPLGSFTRNILDRFERHLLNWKNPKLQHAMCRNSANKVLKKLKTVMLNACTKKQILNKNPFDGFVIHGVRVNKTALTNEEMQLLQNHDLGGNLSLQNVRNLFLFAALTGLRYSDAAALSPGDITKGNDGRLWITITQRKTQDPLHVPMSKEAEKIYQHYREQSKTTGRVLVPYSNVKVNLFLKEIARMANIKKKLTHHVARHTYAVLTLEQGVDIATVSRLMGHTSLKSTQVYARPSNLLLSATLTKLEEGNSVFSIKKGKEEL